MKKNEKSNGKKGMNKKPLAILLALSLLAGGAIGGTIAWLTSQTPAVINTFTIGDINIELKEYDLTEDNQGNYTLDMNTEVVANADYKFVPGDTLPKDPFVKVKEGSEKCYLFIKVTVENNTAKDTSTQTEVKNILSWTVCGQEGNPANLDPNEDWVEYSNSGAPEGVTYYYRVVPKKEDNNDGDEDYEFFHILKDNQVKVSENVVKEVVDEINTNKPKLTFEAAAIQFSHINSVTAAWENLPAAFKPAANPSANA